MRACQVLALLLGFFCLVGAPSSALADVLNCPEFTPEDPSSGKEMEVRAISPDVVVISHTCWAFAGHAYYEFGSTVEVWRDGEKQIEQTLFSSMVTDAGWKVQILPKSDAVKISTGCGDVYSEKDSEQSKMCEETWRYSRKLDRFVRKAVDRESHLAQYEDALKKGDFTAAIAALQKAGEEVKPLSNRAFYSKQAVRLLDLLHASAMKAHKKGNLDEQALKQLLDNWQALIKLTGHSTYLRERDRELVQIKGRQGKEVVVLPRTETVARQLNDIAFFLSPDPEATGLTAGEVTRVREAIDLYEQLTPHFQEREVLLLNLGDAYWSLSRAETKPEPRLKQMRQAYLAYKALRKEKKLPARVEKRLEETK